MQRNGSIAVAGNKVRIVTTKDRQHRAFQANGSGRTRLRYCTDTAYSSLCPGIVATIAISDFGNTTSGKIRPDQWIVLPPITSDTELKRPTSGRPSQRLALLHNNPAVQACIYRANPTSLGPLRTASRAH